MQYQTEILKHNWNRLLPVHSRSRQHRNHKVIVNCPDLYHICDIDCYGKGQLLVQLVRKCSIEYCSIQSDQPSHSGDSYTQTGFVTNETLPAVGNPLGNPVYPVSQFVYAIVIYNKTIA
jgi:hypothetical protein